MTATTATTATAATNHHAPKNRQRVGSSEQGLVGCYCQKGSDQGRDRAARGSDLCEHGHAIGHTGHTLAVRDLHAWNMTCGLGINLQGSDGVELGKLDGLQ